MSHHHEIPAPPQPIRLPPLARGVALVALVAGTGALAWAFGSGHHEIAWSAWLMGSFFALGLGAFGLVWIAITTLSRGVWAVGMRRVPEAMSAWLLPGGLLALVTAAGAHTLFHWSHPEAVAADALLTHKAAFLNLPMFGALVGGSLALWVLFRALIVGNSRKQDQVGGVALSRRNAALSALFIVLFALTLSIVSFYLIMSLEARWFSTMFAVLVFTDLIQTGLAFSALVVGALIVSGQLKGFVGVDHFHSLGKMLFAATGFWAYIYFCQFLLIWYANIPEETIYFVKRWQSGWAIYLLALPALKFVVPFVLMLPREGKRNPRRVAPMAALILFAQFWELFVMVGPALGHPSAGSGQAAFAAHARLPLVEFAAVAGFLGLFYLVFERSLRRHAPVPLKDPWIGGVPGVPRMSEPSQTRRRLLGGALAAGATGLVGCRRDPPEPEPGQDGGAGPDFPSQALLDDLGKVGPIPLRPLGDTGVQVPRLSVGANFHRTLLLSAQFVRLGLSYWDTSAVYEGGRPEEGIGRYLGKHPADRARVFLVTRTYAREPQALTRELAASLARMHTDRVDLYQLHGVEDPAELTPALRAWAEAQKAKGTLRLFGVTFHKNLLPLLAGVARHPWLDAIMFPYSYRSLDDRALNDALRAVREAGIGTVAMKVWGQAVEDEEFESKPLDLALNQRRLKAVWTNPHIDSACAFVRHVPALLAYARAAADPAPLAPADLDALCAHAAATRAGYCAGCAYLCEPFAGGAPISDVARLLMYKRGYQDPARARAGFALLGEQAHRALAAADYREAERRCPHGLPIARYMREALRDLA